MDIEERLRGLADRIEAAEGPDRELDAEIAVALSNCKDARVVWGKGRRWYRQPGPGRIPVAGAYGKGVALGLMFQAVPYTNSLDAAMTLVPEGWQAGGEMGSCYDDVCEAWVWPFESSYEPDWQMGQETQRGNPDGVIATGRTPALALCATALRARSQEN